jgi:hypothetical protein
MQRQVTLYFLVSLFLWASCGHPTRDVTPAFYHWQSRFALTPPELECLEQTETKRIYLRFFDVDWSAEKGKVVPISILSLKELPPKGIEIVPTIYMTNRTLLKTSPADLDTLQKRVSALLFSLLDEFGIPNPAEVQIDCDWSSSTREKYFLFLERMCGDLNQRKSDLSVTIRLHQLKYRDKTGIPPADRGMLMFYNMGQLDDPEESNSILDLGVGRSYLRGYRRYPLPLDVALPIFAWGVVFRQEKPVFLLNGLRADEAEGESGLEKIGNNRFKVRESHYFRGEYLYRGDLIRTEAVTDSLLRGAALMLARTLDEDQLNVALYHLDSLTISHYDLETFSSVWDAFR